MPVSTLKNAPAQHSASGRRKQIPDDDLGMTEGLLQSLQHNLT